VNAIIVVLKMNDPYQPPNTPLTQGADVEQVRQRRKFWLRAIWISIAGVAIPPMFGLVGTVVGMVGAFGELSKTGEADPEALAGDISVALLTTMWGLVVSAIALLVLIGVLIRFFTLPKVAGVPPRNIQAPPQR
jgi:MotA/TolQ/ExbB proton channel family